MLLSWLCIGPHYSDEFLALRRSGMTRRQRLVVKGHAKHAAGSGYVRRGSSCSARRLAPLHDGSQEPYVPEDRMPPRRPLLGHGRLDPLATPFVDTPNALGPASHHDPRSMRVQARGNVSLFTNHRIAVRRCRTPTISYVHTESPFLRRLSCDFEIGISVHHKPTTRTTTLKGELFRYNPSGGRKDARGVQRGRHRCQEPGSHLRATTRLERTMTAGYSI